MRRLILAGCVALLLAGCGLRWPESLDSAVVLKPATATSLADARRGFVTRLARRSAPGSPVTEPPAGVFEAVKYQSPAGELSAYLSPDPGDGQRHPAVVWITGGDCNTVDAVWQDASPTNDQTAAAYRRAGLVMMFPSLRGGNDNPGAKEGFYGEVDDVLSATEFLARQPYVDPGRIYLGGHSTGGTLVLLVAETSDRYRAVFSFGPVALVDGYPPEFLPYDASDPNESALRSPGRWLHSVRSPVFVFEGTGQGNLDSLTAMRRASGNPKAHFYPVRGADHFSILGPTNDLIAAKLLHDDGPTLDLGFTEDELSRPFGR